jgi:hypothetical protein
MFEDVERPVTTTLTYDGNEGSESVAISTTFGVMEFADTCLARNFTVTILQQAVVMDLLDSKVSTILAYVPSSDDVAQYTE